MSKQSYDLLVTDPQGNGPFRKEFATAEERDAEFAKFDVLAGYSIETQDVDGEGNVADNSPALAQTFAVDGPLPFPVSGEQPANPDA